MIINNLGKIRELIEWEDALQKEVNEDIGKFFGLIKGEGYIEIRKIYRITRSVKIVDKNTYTKILMLASNYLKKHQLGPEYSGRLFVGGYSGKTRFKFRKRGGNSYLSEIEGGFPTAIKGNQGYIYGVYPDIDSTSSALILLVEAASELGIFDEEIDNLIKKGVSYLRSRDFNRDGILEQYENEDWMLGVSREGGVLYSNALYLKAMEKVFYLYIDKEKNFADELQDEIIRCYDSIEKYFWIGDSYVDSISLRGSIILRYSIDSIELGDTYIYENHPHLKNHLEKIIHILRSDSSRWMLRDIYPPKGEYDFKLKSYLGYNGGIIPYYLAFLSRKLIAYSLENYTPHILAEAIKLRNHEWILDNMRHTTPTSRLENNMEILATLNELKEKLRK